MSLKYHGLLIKSKHSGEFHFGISNLINACSSTSWVFTENIPDSAKSVIQRFHNKAYWQCTIKTSDIVDKLLRSIDYLSYNIKIYENDDILNYVRQNIKEAKQFPRLLNAPNEISYHLDSFIYNLRILADCIAFAIPFFYKTKKSISSRSFSKHKKWFLNNSNFDKKYLKILNEHTKWFNLLAGDNFQGIRDLSVHRFGIYQIGYVKDSNNKKQLTISLFASGSRDPSLTVTLSTIMNDYFNYLDNTYEHFYNKMKSQLSPLLNKTSIEFSHRHNYSDFKDLETRYNPLFLPRIESI